MWHLQARLRSAIAIISVLMLLVFGSAATAFATTGPTKFLPGTHYKVPSALQRLYIGQYTIKSVANAARLSGGAMGIEVDDRGNLYGVGQFYGYDEQGLQTTWTATLYNFHQTKAKVMIFDLTGPAGRPLLGRLFVTRSKSGDLAGQIELPGGRFPIVWHKISSR